MSKTKNKPRPAAAGKAEKSLPSKPAYTPWTKSWQARLLAILVMLAVLPIPVGVLWQAFAAPLEARRTPAPGQMVDAGGYKLHINCQGQGSPTVVLEGGIAEWSIHWSKVAPEVARFTRVCTYDRAGLGWSESGSQPRSAQQVVSELHTLLANAGEKGPFILAAHSFWGPAARLYQQAYPDEVAGIVLVESWSPELFSPTPKVIEDSINTFDGLRSMAILGLVRLMDKANLLPLSAILQANLLPEDQLPAFYTTAYKPSFWDTISQEYSAMPADAEAYKTLGKLGNLPLVVIQAGKRQPNDFPSREVWGRIQQDLAQLSTQGSLVVAENSGHSVQLQQPQVVIDALRQVFEASR
jgi:pimeloyl-ACP methyl ester carboxylesterase